MSFSTIWHMEQADVDNIVLAKQSNFFALQVDGTDHPITWLEQEPELLLEIDVTGAYGAIVTRETDLSDGSIIKASSQYPVSLGKCYTWNGSDMLPDKFSSVSKNSVKITNNTTETWTFGLTKSNPNTGNQQAICADVLLRAQPVTYTPINAIYAKVGRNYSTSTIITDIGSWSRFKLTQKDTTFSFDTYNTRWAINTDV